MGYCQSGMIMAAAAFLARNFKPSEAEVHQALGNLCRCGTYKRVREAMQALAAGQHRDGEHHGT